jgi:nucleotide-binding universal stress UspA family protein
VQEAVEEVIGELPAPRPPFTLRIVSQKAQQAIVKEARSADAELIVLGGHGEARFRDAIFGTTATHVVRHADCPVLVAQTDPASPYQKVMLAVGDTEEVPALRAITDTLAPGAAVYGVNAFDPSFRSLLEGSAAIQTELGAREKKLAQSLAGGHALVTDGDPLAVLTDKAEKIAPDLVAMGTSQRAYVNSYAVDALFWCQRDLLIVPTRGHTEAPEPVLGGTFFA